jgi:cytochrome c oxidase subunit IV
MMELPKVIPKKVWFLLFNVGTIAYLIANGSLRWNAISIVSYGLALLIMNGIALISARKYKGWK